MFIITVLCFRSLWLFFYQVYCNINVSSQYVVSLKLIQYSTISQFLKKGDKISVLRLDCKRLTSDLFILSRAPNWLTFMEPSYHAVSCPCGKELRAKITLGIESANNNMNEPTDGFTSAELKKHHSPAQHLDCSLVRDLEPEDPVKLHLDFWSVETGNGICVLF